MKKLLLALAATTMLTGSAFAGGHSPVKIGVILGFTGPIESITPAMGDAAEMAMKEVSDSGKLLDGVAVESFARTPPASTLPQQPPLPNVSSPPMV